MALALWAWAGVVVRRGRGRCPAPALRASHGDPPVTAMTRAPKRDFIFIDESGDPGFRSTHFACLALHATDVGLRAVIECCASLRFFRAMYAELKPLHEDARLRPRLAEILRTLQDAGHVKYTATYLEKARYTGWYLGVGQGTRFRNWALGRAPGSATSRCGDFSRPTSATRR